MTEQADYVERLIEGLNPNDPCTIALREAALARPVPAIEKPLGPDHLQPPSKPVALIDSTSLDGLAGWNQEMTGVRPWTG